MKKLIIANWKSHKTFDQAKEWLESFEEAVKMRVALGDLPNSIAIAPSFPQLQLVSEYVQASSLKHIISLAVQDLSPFEEGAYTGEVSAHNLINLPIQYAIVGHSERREYFHEDAQLIARKVDQALRNKMQPIVCVDRNQAKEQAQCFDEETKKKLIIAYEPVEYIGKGKAQPVAQILDAIKEIKEYFGDIPVLYGGSVNEDNDDELKHEDEIAGLLVGSASLNAGEFAEMVK